MGGTIGKRRWSWTIFNDLMRLAHKLTFRQSALEKKEGRHHPRQVEKPDDLDF